MYSKLIFTALIFSKLSCIGNSNSNYIKNNEKKIVLSDSIPDQQIKKINYYNLENAFNGGLVINQDYFDKGKKGDRLTFRKQEIGFIKITSGKIIACDGFVNSGSEPFKYNFPKGEFPVDLAIGRYSISNDERIGFARIKFSENKPVRWEVALQEGQDLSKLKEDEIFGYGVDSGTGSFMDTEGKQELDRYFDVENKNMRDSNYDAFTDAFDKTGTPVCKYIIWEKNGKNIALFSSGLGDGFYVTYIGYDSKGKICRLVTDFDLIIK